MNVDLIRDWLGIEQEEPTSGLVELPVSPPTADAKPPGDFDG